MFISTKKEKPISPGWYKTIFAYSYLFKSNSQMWVIRYWNGSVWLNVMSMSEPLSKVSQKRIYWDKA